MWLTIVRTLVGLTRAKVIVPMVLFAALALAGCAAGIGLGQKPPTSAASGPGCVAIVVPQEAAPRISTDNAELVPMDPKTIDLFVEWLNESGHLN